MSRSASRVLRPALALLGAWLTLAFLALSPARASAAAQDGLLPVTEAFALQVAPADGGQLRLDWRIADAYYLYRDRIRVDVLEGGQQATLELPAGASKQDEYFGEVEVYRGQASARLRLQPAADAASPVRLRVVVQGCHEVEPLVCYPPHASTFVLDGDGIRPERASAAASSIDAAAAETAADADASTVQADAAAAPVFATRAGVAQLAGILLSALLGGLLLNLMPCVLPVLSLKLLSLVESGAGPAQARRRALAYTAGVLATFAAVGALALAARRAGIGLGWGFQLQQPVVVAVLAYVMLVLGLALSGVFLFATRLGGVGQRLAAREGVSGDFFTGVLAVVVASPCTAPFMGVALAAAFALSGVVALLVFLALGLGLALPFLLVGFVPALASRLPRPGAWMETLKQGLAFPLYATAAWLAWVLSRQHGSDALGWLLAGLLLLALTLWASERLRYARWPVLRPAALALSLLALGPLWQIHRLPPPPAAAGGALQAAADGSVPFTPGQLAQLREGGRTVFVNMTADWCVTCKANERRLFATDGFRQALAGHDAVYLKGDWTRMDPAITRFLEQHGAVGVPLYVVFRPGRADGAVLSTVPTRAQVEAALQGDAI